jgi:hypothetical protein
MRTARSFNSGVLSSALSVPFCLSVGQIVPVGYSSAA